MDWLQFSPDEWDAIRLSLRVATVGTLASIPLGLFVAYALARWRFRSEEHTSELQSLV